MKERKEISLDVEVPHNGPNAEDWAQDSLRNSAKYEIYVKQEIHEFIERARKKRIDLTLLKVKRELVGVKVYGPQEAIATHRYYFHQKKIPRRLFGRGTRKV